MTLLDRFRSQPRDKHPDVAVRLAYVEELPLDDPQAIAAMARDDADPRVRRAAVAKLMDPAALGAVLRSDADESVRSRTLEMLRDIAVEAFEGTTEAESLDAVDVLHGTSGVLDRRPACARPDCQVGDARDRGAAGPVTVVRRPAAGSGRQAWRERGRAPRRARRAPGARRHRGNSRRRAEWRPQRRGRSCRRFA